MRILREGLMAAVVAASGLFPAVATGAGSDSNPFVVVGRTIIQDQGDWQVDYRVRYEGDTGLIVAAEQVMVRVEGWVSNSRIPGHGAPRRSSLSFSGPSGLHGTADVVASDDEERRCRERAILQFWVEDQAGKPVARVFSSGGDRGRVGDGDDDGDGGEAHAQVLALAPGMTIRARLRLEHRHVVYGTYDPLLGIRDVEIGLGSGWLRDTLPLDREHRVAQPSRASFEVPEDRRDTQYFVSGPDSLHLAAHIPGNAFFRFPEVPVRYGTGMRLRFSYLIAAGTEGTCRARITQYKDSPVSWKVLADGRRDWTLTTIGRWVQVEQFLMTEPEATTLALDFRIEGAEVEAGELWIDDVSLEPVGTGRVDP